MIIGVTGGVGAGKSTVLDILKNEYNAHVILSDDVAKKLMEPGMASYEAVVSFFGEEILTAGKDSEIDRNALAKIVFNDEEKLKTLNSLTHPKVKEEISHLINTYYSEDPDGMIVIESALLIDAGYRNIVDEVWAVIAEPEVRISRLMETRGYSKERSLDVMDKQKSNEVFIKKSDFAVHNSGHIDDTRRQIAERVKYLNERD